MEQDRRIFHNVHISGVDNAGEVTWTFHQFTDDQGRRHMPGRAITVKVSAKAPLLLVMELAHRAGLEAVEQDTTRRAPLPAHTVKIE